MKSENCTLIWNRRDCEVSKMNTPPTILKASFNSKKMMLCIWWDWKGILYYELLPENQTINSNKYCSQLDQLKAALYEKYLGLVNSKCIIFHQDTTKLCFFDDQEKTVTAWLEVLIPLPYSPDIAPSDVHLFCSLKNSLNGKNSNSLEDCKRHLE